MKSKKLDDVIFILESQTNRMIEHKRWKQRELRKEFPYKTSTKTQAAKRKIEFRKDILQENVRLSSFRLAVKILKALNI